MLNIPLLVAKTEISMIYISLNPQLAFHRINHVNDKLKNTRRHTRTHTGPRIYENLLPCLMVRGLLFNSIQKLRENNSQWNKRRLWQKWFIKKKKISDTRFEHFFKSLNSRTFDILKHVSRFPRPKITQKHNFKPLCARTYLSALCRPKLYSLEFYLQNVCIWQYRLHRHRLLLLSCYIPQ